MYFKLKKDARQFFQADVHRDVLTLPEWTKKVIPEQLLEPCAPIFIRYGIQERKDWTSLSGWSSEENGTAKFHFTIIAKDIKNSDYNKVQIAAIMDDVQEVLDRHFQKG